MIYRPILEFPDYYAGLDGTIVSGKSGKVLRPGIDRYGYQVVVLSKRSSGQWIGCKRFTRRVHKLIAKTYLGECPVGREVCHDNGIKQDCSVGNLYYGTRSQNQRDRVRHRGLG